MTKIYRIQVTRDGVTREPRQMNARALVIFVTSILVGDRIRLERVR